MTQTIDQTLAERGARYGEFDDHANITQGIKDAMKHGRNWPLLQDDMKEALEMVAHKIGRILNGDPGYIDSWTDIIGYTRLVEKRLINEHAEPIIVSGQEAENRAARAALDATDMWDDFAASPCDCPECNPGSNQVSLDEMLAGIKSRNPNKNSPSDDQVRSALRVLMAAGVISLVEDGDA